MRSSASPRTSRRKRGRAKGPAPGSRPSVSCAPTVRPRWVSRLALPPASLAIAGARRAAADRDPARLQRLGHHPLQADMQQAVLQVRAIDHDVVGEHEAALERAAGDAAIQHLTFLPSLLDPAGHHQRVVLHDQVQFLRPEPGHRHGQAVGVLAGLLDVVGRVARCVRRRTSRVHQTGQPVETDGGTEQRSKIESRHGRTSCFSKVTMLGRPYGPARSALRNPDRAFRTH